MCQAADVPQANLRRGRSSEPGRIYVCTTVVHRRRPLFADWKLGRLVVHSLRWNDAQGRTDTIAFVVMPDHLHWLFSLTGTQPLPRVLQSLKNYSARRVNAALGEDGPVWQAGFHDHAVRREEDLRAMARYVVFNPVRAGIVRSLRDYPLWDAMWI
jgi:putative transposase